MLKAVAFIFISPLLGMLLGALMMLLISWLFRRQTPRRVDRWSRRLQLVSASAYALGHGGNDAQKTIGIIWMLLISAGIMGSDEAVPMWVVISCYASIGLGTAFGGWRIIKLMGQKITKLKPVGGFCAQTGGAITLSSSQRRWAFPFRRLTPLPVPSSVSVRHRNSRRFAGGRRRYRLGVDS